MALLRDHKRAQAELKLANRLRYTDFGLVFAKCDARGLGLGAPLSAPLITGSLQRLCEDAGVPRIILHGLRHTCASLLLAAGEPAYVVAKRLGHSNVKTTLETYVHVLPGQEQSCAARLASILWA